MTKIPDEIWENYTCGSLGVAIYVEHPSQVQTARRFLQRLPKHLSKHGKIELGYIAYIMFFPPTSKKGRKGRPVGVITQYLFENVTLDFYKALFGILEEKKHKTKWLSTYHVALQRPFTSFGDFLRHVELEAEILQSKINIAVSEERIRQYEKVTAYGG